MLPWCDIFYLEIILLRWCDIFYLDIILLPWCNIFYLDIILVPWYATPKVTKYQRCNFIIQIHQFTIKIDKININLLFECVKIVEFNFNSHVFHVMYQETRFLNQDACFFKSRRETTIFDQFCFQRDWNRAHGLEFKV